MNKPLTNPRYFPLFFQIFRFGTVGLAAASIHFMIVVLLVQFVFLTPLIANIFGFLTAFQLSYWGHRLWTFQESSILHRVAFPKLMIVQIINFLANQSLFYFFLTLHLPYPLALFFVLAILSLFTFIFNKYWVFYS